jgi:Ger(x)C family germination protein
VQRILTAALLAALLLTTGCWDRRDPEAVAWVTAIGIDKGPSGNYIFSFQIPVITGTAGGGGGGGGGSQATAGTQVDVYAVASPDLVTAMSASQAFVARRVTLVHAKSLVVGEEVARENVGPIIGAATRYREFRRNLTVLVAKGKAYDFLRNARPRLEANASRWYELLQQSAQETGFVGPTRIHEFVLEMERSGVGARATLVAYRPDIAAGSEEIQMPPRAEGEPPPVPGDSMAGAVPRIRELPVEFMGMAVFKGAKLAGFLNGNETRMVALLRGELRQAYMSLTDPLAPTHRIAIRLKGQHKPALHVTRRGTQVSVTFTVPVEGEVVSTGGEENYTLPQNEARFNASVSKQLQSRINDVLEKTLHQWGTDMYFIGNQLMTGFRSIPDWEAFNWGQRVNQVAFSVDVRFSIRRFGLQAESATSRE